MSGLFISFEGTDGAGKTTQINMLKEYFEQQGVDVVTTREPGGTPIGEKIREIIIDNNNSEMTRYTEVLLYAAARAQLVSELIEPSLKHGKVVIADRFLDSSMVYQGFARGLGEEVITDINKYAVKGLKPDITFFLKLTPEQSIERKREQAELDRMESAGDNFHRRVYDGYMMLSRRNSSRICVIDATATVEDIHRSITRHIEKVFSDRGI
jgi:dTMP kinase